MAGKINDGGPAYPSRVSVSPHTVRALRTAAESLGMQEIVAAISHHPGMSLRDWFAAMASETDIADYMPRTVGDTADLLERLGRIPPRRAGDDVMRAYSSGHLHQLRRWARYQHADAMIAERAKAKP